MHGDDIPHTLMEVVQEQGTSKHGPPPERGQCIPGNSQLSAVSSTPSRVHVSFAG